jgi:hypothetical protein
MTESAPLELATAKLALCDKNQTRRPNVCLLHLWREAHEPEISKAAVDENPACNPGALVRGRASPSSLRPDRTIRPARTTRSIQSNRARQSTGAVQQRPVREGILGADEPGGRQRGGPRNRRI